MKYVPIDSSIEAIRFDPDKIGDAELFVDNYVTQDNGWGYWGGDNTPPYRFFCETQEEWLIVYPGMWITKNSFGFETLRDKEFRKKFKEPQ